MNDGIARPFDVNVSRGSEVIPERVASEDVGSGRRGLLAHCRIFSSGSGHIGAGILVAPGAVATVAHLVHASGDVSIACSGGLTARAKNISVHPKWIQRRGLAWDMALVEIDPEASCRHAELADDWDVHDPIWAIDFSERDHRLEIQSGKIGGLIADRSGRVVLVSGLLPKVTSGTPVFDRERRVIGIVCGDLVDRRNLGGCSDTPTAVTAIVPIGAARELLGAR